MTKYFITFGGGSQEYREGSKILTDQILKTGYFDVGIGFTDLDLQNDTDFWNKHSDFILSNRRGFGYWIWKSYLIMKTMEKMEENDVLLYLDAGCEINMSEKEFLLEAFEKIKKILF